MKKINNRTKNGYRSTDQRLIALVCVMFQLSTVSSLGSSGQESTTGTEIFLEVMHTCHGMCGKTKAWRLLLSEKGVGEYQASRSEDFEPRDLSASKRVVLDGTQIGSLTRLVESPSVLNGPDAYDCHQSLIDMGMETTVVYRQRELTKRVRLRNCVPWLAKEPRPIPSELTTLIEITSQLMKAIGDRE